MVSVFILALMDVFLIILIVIVLIAAKILFAQKTPDDIEPLDPYSLKTGDILCVGYTHPFGWFVTAWSGSKWYHHLGVVWIDPSDNQIYVMEAATYRGKYRGVFKIPFSLWIKINKQSRLSIRRCNRSVDAAQLEETFIKHKGMVLDSYKPDWYRFLVKRRYVDRIKTNYTCHELIIEMLQDVDVIKKKYTCSSYLAIDIMHGKMDLEDGYSYSSVCALDPKEYVKIINTENKLKQGRCILSSC